MSELKNKIDFTALVSVKMANSNGDPLNGNRPRIDYDGFGEISDVCIKRKIRNRMQDMGYRIFVQSADRSDDGCTCLRERAKMIAQTGSREEYAKLACQTWMDVRSFGQVFAFKSKESEDVSGGIRGPVSIHQAVSVFPIEVRSMQITKSVNSEPGEKRGSDTMGMKHFVRYGFYRIKGAINVQLAEKTGFSYEDAQIIKECLRTLFVNDASSARPEGSMEVYRLYWWEHNSKIGQYSSAQVHRLVDVQLKQGLEEASDIDDYEITLHTLPDLQCEVIDGV